MKKLDKKEVLKLLQPVKEKTRAPMPEIIKPMLATLVSEPADTPDWIFEIKWDGYRAISYIQEERINILSRNNKPFNEKYYPIVKALKDWKINAVVDGEIVVTNEKGFPDFEALQAWRSEADGPLYYYLFDLIWIEGYDMTKVPLTERRNILARIVKENQVLRHSQVFKASGQDFFRQAETLKIEGIIAKKADSYYLPGVRSKNWLKVKTLTQQEAVIGGYTINENTSKLFSSLLLGIFENNDFVPIQNVGTGFTKKMQAEILRKLSPLKINDCPFSIVPNYNKSSRFRPNPPKAEVTWVKPEVVVEITYNTSGTGGIHRHPSFKRLREDKNPREVVREAPLKLQDLKPETDNTQNLFMTEVKTRKSLLNPTEETQVKNIDGHSLKFTNLSKVFWPEERIRKRDLINYYYRITPYILPYIKDRPQTLNRFPNGIYHQSFYQKDVTGKIPDWIKTFGYYSEADQREKQFLVCTDEASLLYVANLGCIEINPWSSRINKPDKPDWCIIDLDPGEKSFNEVIEAARVTKLILDAADIPSYCKTSGSSGLHIYIPLGGKYTYEDSKELGRSIARAVNFETSKFTTIERYTSKRNGKLYIDFLQNRPQATVAAPYSLRPKPGATVSMPLHWEEVRKGLSIQQFNIHNAAERCEKEGDLFKGVLDTGIDLILAKQRIDQLIHSKL